MSHIAKHTPSEWDVNEFTDLEGDRHIVVVQKSNGCPLAHMYECGSETRPNARLMAAAPELLRSLILMLRTHDKPAESLPQEVVEQMWIVLAQARAAIAKATGNSPEGRVDE